MPLLVIMILIIAVGAGRSPEGAGARGLLRRLLEGACGRVVMRLLYIYIYIEIYRERERYRERGRQMGSSQKAQPRQMEIA